MISRENFIRCIAKFLDSDEDKHLEDLGLGHQRSCHEDWVLINPNHIVSINEDSNGDYCFRMLDGTSWSIKRDQSIDDWLLI